MCEDLDSLILIPCLLNQEMRMFGGFGFYWYVQGVDNVKEGVMSLP